MKPKTTKNPETWIKSALPTKAEERRTAARPRLELSHPYRYTGPRTAPAGADPAPVATGTLAADGYRIHMTDYTAHPTDPDGDGNLVERIGTILRDAEAHRVASCMVQARVLSEAVAVCASGLDIWADGVKHKKPVTLELYRDGHMAIEGKDCETGIENRATLAAGADVFAVSLPDDAESVTVKADAKYLQLALSHLVQAQAVELCIASKHGGNTKMVSLSALLPDRRPFALVMGMLET